MLVQLYNNRRADLGPVLIGVRMLLADSHEDPYREAKYIKLMHQSQIDGLILATVSEEFQWIKSYQADNIPVIFFDNEPHDLKCNIVLLNNIKATEIAVDHLVSLGHKKIALICGNTKESTARYRRDGFIKAMMIIHSPQPWMEVNQSENRYFAENREVWRALEDAAAAGKVRTIGVSNFQREDIENILAVCKIRPAVNQVLCHISNTPLSLMEYCRSQEIAVEAYSPVAHGAALKDPKISELAAKYQVSVPQLCIRYDWQLGTIVLPKTANPAHMLLCIAGL